MQTILIPTDFSETAMHAALYAIEMAKQTGVQKIILLNTYTNSNVVVGDPLVPVLEVFTLKELEKASEEGLLAFKFFLQYAIPPSVTIETIHEYGFLANTIQTVCKEHKVDLIVMGISGAGNFQENFIGSNTIDVAKETTVPVIIVPNKANIHQIKRIAIATDFKDVSETTPFTVMRKILDETGAKVFILNVDHNEREFNDDTLYERMLMETFLEKYNPTINLIDNPDFIDGINYFVQTENIDMVIIIPKKHGLFESLFKRSHTKMLAFHTNVPILVVHK